MNDLMLVNDSTEKELLGFFSSEYSGGEKGGGEREEADLGEELDSE